MFERCKPQAEMLRYYRGLVEAYRANREHPVALVDELDRVVSEIQRFGASG